jgi:hypothetical protein
MPAEPSEQPLGGLRKRRTGLWIGSKELVAQRAQRDIRPCEARDGLGERRQACMEAAPCRILGIVRDHGSAVREFVQQEPESISVGGTTCGRVA